MSLVRDSSGRLHVETGMAAESLMDKALRDGTGWVPVLRALPDLKVVKIGGQNIIDRGRKVIVPLLGEIVLARAE